MEISYTLIVAIMYVTIISFGLAGLLTSLSTILQKRNTGIVAKVQLNWILILLVVHFNMTWHAVYITSVENWTYFGFVAIVFGPVLGFFTANILSPNSFADATKNHLIEHYLSIKPRILVLFILIQFWILAADRIFERGLVDSAYFNLALIAISVYMLFRKSYKSQQYGITIIWTLLITGLVLRSLGVIG